MKLNLLKSKNGKIFSLSLWKRGASEYMDPMRDWTIGLGVASVVLLCGVVYIIFDFYAQFRDPSQPVVIENNPIQYNEKKIKLYSDIYIEKERVFNELRKDLLYIPVHIDAESTSLLPTPE